MDAYVSGEKPASKKQQEWRCSVCEYIHTGDSPPQECLQCSSSSKEFHLDSEKEKLRYDGKKFDVLLINGSSHRGHNTDIMIAIAENTLIRMGASFRRFNLSELEIRHCWCCYSMEDAACTYPCRNQLDDAPALHEMLIDAKAVIIASPINWNNMSARLKDFLDRLNCIQNRALLGEELLVPGKIFGVLINGHEDGATKTAMDIFTYFQQMGFVFAPFGFAYRTHGAQYNAGEDNDFFRTDKTLRASVEGVVANVVKTMNLGIEEKLKGKIVPVCQ